MKLQPEKKYLKYLIFFSFLCFIIFISLEILKNEKIIYLMILIIFISQEPLNSEDDVTDDDPADLFDTDNVVVCQYDKVFNNFILFNAKKVILI